jgi:flagellar FliJ protein
MTRFQFRLDRVLRLREGLERQRAADLGHALHDEERRRGELSAAEDRLEDAGREPVPGAQAPVAAGALAARSHAIQAAAEQVHAAEERSRAAEQHSDVERDRFRSARQDRETLARLRERRREVWKTEVARNEQKITDEVARRRKADGDQP